MLNYFPLILSSDGIWVPIQVSTSWCYDFFKAYFIARVYETFLFLWIVNTVLLFKILDYNLVTFGLLIILLGYYLATFDKTILTIGANTTLCILLKGSLLIVVSLQLDFLPRRKSCLAWGETWRYRDHAYQETPGLLLWAAQAKDFW